MKRVALVVGGSGDIGSAIQATLEKQGWIVCIADIKEPSQKTSTFFRTNLTDGKSISAAISQILSTFQTIDCVIMAASGPYEHKPLMKISWTDIDHQIAVQARGLLLVTQALRQQIDAKYRTRFIVILSEYCLGKPPSGFSAYGVAKYSTYGLAKAMAVELAASNCTVNMVSPGLTDTGLIRHLPSVLLKLTKNQNPRGRLAVPQDVASVVSFLASPDADYLNGVNIPINGGSVMV